MAASSSNSMFNDLKVQFSAKGQEDVLAAIKKIEAHWRLFNGQIQSSQNAFMSANAKAVVLGSTVASIAGTGASGASAGLGKLQAVLGTLTHTFQTMTAPIALVTAGLTGMAMAGFNGTVEFQQLSLSMTLFHRQIASIFIPVIEAITAGYRRMWEILSKMGPVAQKVFLILGIGLASIAIGMGVLLVLLTVASVAAALLAGAVMLVGIAIEVVNAIIIAASGGLKALVDVIGAIVVAVMALLGLGAAGTFAASIAAISAAIGGLLAFSENLRVALWGIVEAYIKLGEAAWPIVKVFLAIGAAIVQYRIVDPIIALCFWLEVAINLVTKLLEAFVRMNPIIGRIGRMLDGAAGPQQQVALNQTGSESGESTFSRIQQEALRVTSGTVTPVDRNTTALDRLTTAIEAWIGRFPSLPSVPEVPSTSAIVSGAAAIAADPFAWVGRRLGFGGSR